MGAWPIAFFSLLLVVVTTANPVAKEQENGKPCLAWHCQHRDRRLVQPSSDINTAKNEVRSVGTKPCLSWNCRREMLLQKFLSEKRDSDSTVKKSNGLPNPEETPCLSWDCKRKRRALSQTASQSEIPQSAKPETAADEEPCLTKDCRTGKRSLVRGNRGEETAPVETPQITVRAKKRRSLRGCLTWRCTGRGGGGR